MMLHYLVQMAELKVSTQGKFGYNFLSTILLATQIRLLLKTENPSHLLTTVK